MRFFVLGSADDLPEAPKGVAIETDPDAAFDAVAVTESATKRELIERFPYRLDPILPIVRLGDGTADEYDFSAEQCTKSTLHEAAKVVRDLHRKLASLPKSPGGEGEPGLDILTLLHTRDRSAEAHWDPNRPQMVSYPFLAAIDGAPKLLEWLHAGGLLNRRFFDRLHLCGNCGSSRLNPREECPQCRSSQLKESRIVHHYTCGHQDAEEHFQKLDGLVCPKCRRRLRHYGEDYDRPGTVQSCQACGHTTTEPEIGFKCADCGAHTDAALIDVRDWYHYDIIADGRRAVENGRLPMRSLEETVAPVSEALSYRDFILVVDRLVQHFARRDEPFYVVRVRMADGDAIRDQIGARAHSDLHQLVFDLVRSAFPYASAFSARSETIYVSLAVEREEIDDSIEEFRRAVQETIRPSLKVSVDVMDRSELDAALAEIR